MIRQCLYCAKELPKNSTSNFCSKECWTEYKKLKAMNIDVDKQATVLLKKNDLPVAPDNSTSQPSPDTSFPTAPSESLPAKTIVESPRVVPEPGAASEILVEKATDNHSDLEEKITRLETDFITKTNELSDFINTKLNSINTDNASDVSMFGDKIVRLENEIKKIDGFEVAITKLEERLISLERKLKNLTPSESQMPGKKGFFAKLFG